MGFKYYFALLLCALTASDDLIKTLFFPDITLFSPFTFGKYVGDLFYNLFPLVVPLVFLIIYFKAGTRAAKFSAWTSLFGGYLVYLWLVWMLWAPIAEGGRMSSTFAISVVFSIIYANVAALAVGLITLVGLTLYGRGSR